MYGIDEQLNIAKEFREAIEETDLSDAPGFLSGFPEDCCSWASYVIGNYLKYELGLNPIEIQAERDAYDGTDPHSWIEVNNITIDITSDEFEDSDKKVIVSLNSEWHKGWKVIKKAKIVNISEYDKIDYGTKLKPSDVYNLLTGKVRHKCT